MFLALSQPQLSLRRGEDEWELHLDDPPAGAGKRQRATSCLMQLDTSESPMLSSAMSTPDTVPAAVMVQRTLSYRSGWDFA